ncbi:MAG: hypothetical protein A2145_06455 [candidate division Zixibacteria bacterium RBG_16_40_9]|nr:MAG: hypothetical protein A2145_06455 [candidate division Zixibacteria bacterium RBG_16_40_9]
MRKTYLFFFLLILFLYQTSVSFSKGRYAPGDWVSYTNLKFVTCIAQDFRNIYFATAGGVLRYSKFSQEWEEPWTESDGLISNRVNQIAYDPGYDRIWFQTSRGACYYQPTFQEWYYGGTFPDSLVQTGTGKVDLPHFFTEFGYNFFKDAGYIEDQLLRKYPIRVYLKDDWDNVWMGTGGLGVAVGNLRSLQLQIIRFGLAENNVKTIFYDKEGNQLWLGGLGTFSPSRGITKYNLKNKTWEYYEAFYTQNLQTNEVNLIQGDNQFIWFGTPEGLIKYDKKKQTWQNYNSFAGLLDDNILALKPDGRFLWIGTRFGVNLYDSKKDSLIALNEGLPQRPYIYTIETDSNWVWVGTRTGVYRLTKGEAIWHKFTTPDGLIAGRINCITRFENEIWFGSDLGVLAYNLKTDTRTLYQSHTKIPGDEPRQIVLNKKVVWVASPDGALKLDRSTDNWRVFTTADGLLDDNVQALFLDGDYIWFGTPKGLTKFYWNSSRRID